RISASSRGAPHEHSSAAVACGSSGRGPRRYRSTCWRRADCRPPRSPLCSTRSPARRSSGPRSSAFSSSSRPATLPPAHDPKVIVVMPAFNAARTLRITYEDLPTEHYDGVILVDDGSTDETVRLARELGLTVFVHTRNMGYGANQKTCYTEALRVGADIV